MSLSLANRRVDKAWWAERRFWLGVVCSAFFLVLAFRRVDWGELWAVLRAVDGSYLLLATVVCGLRLLAGSLRWRALVLPLGPLQVGEAFAYLLIGHMANNLLPLRAGEFVRATLMGEKKGFSKSAVLATIMVDRLLDVLVLVACAFLLMLTMPLPPLVKQSALVFGGVGCLVAAGLWWAAGRGLTPETPKSQNVFDRWALGRGTRLSGLVQGILRLGRSFVNGLAAVRSPRQVGIAFAYSTLGWSLGVGFTWLVLQACHLDLPWSAALMIVVVVNFGVAIPSAPGFIGVMHFLAVLALKPWSVEQSAALGFAVIYHALAFLLTVGLGVVCLVVERKSSREPLGQPMALPLSSRAFRKARR